MRGRPPVLLIDPDAERRRFLARGLAAESHEVVPCLDAAEGLRFARGLASAVVVAPAASAAGRDGELGDLAGPGRDLVLLATDAEEPPGELPGDVTWIDARGQPSDEVLAKLLLLLLGREVGLEADAARESLVGDLAATPLLELLRSLADARVDGRLELPGGLLHLAGGQVIAAAAGRARGRKAFCRLARCDRGPLRLVPGPPDVDREGVDREGIDREGVDREGAEREIDEDLDSLIAAAIGDALVELPDRRSRLEVEMGPGFFDAASSPLAREILTAAHRGGRAGDLLDALPAPDGEIAAELEILTAAGALALAPPEPSVVVVTDSSCDLPLTLARETGIVVVRPEAPESSPPGERDFAQVFGRHLAERDVVALHPPAELSDAVDHARAAARAERAAAPERPDGSRPAVEVVDGRQAGPGLGLLALFAARMAARGTPAPEVAERLRYLRDRVHALVLVDRPDRLARDSRGGGGPSWMGRVLRAKPILGFDAGRLVPVERARGGRAALARLLDLLAERCPPGGEVVAGVAHARAPEAAGRLLRLLEERYRVRELIAGEMGPALGALAGPGAVAVAIFAPAPSEAAWIAPLEDGA